MPIQLTLDPNLKLSPTRFAAAWNVDPRTDDLAKEIQQLMAEGKLISDEVTCKVVEDRLKQDDAKNGVLFDGFPRTIPQAEWLDQHLKGKNEIVLKASKDKTTLYCSYKQLSGETRLPSLFNFCFYKLNTSEADLDARVPYIEIVNSDKNSNAFKRILLALGNKNKDYDQTLDTPILLEDNLLQDKPSPFVIPQGLLTFVDSGVNDLSINTHGLLKISLDAKLQSSGPTKLQIDLMCRLENQPDFSVNVFNDTKISDLQGQAKTQDLQFTSYIPASCVAGGKFRPQAVLLSKNSPVQIEELKVKIERIEAPDFRNCHVDLY